MPANFGFNSKRINSTNRPITLGGMLVNQNSNGPSSTKRIYNWYKLQEKCQGEVFECIWGIKRGQWGPPSNSNNFYHPYYSHNMYLRKI